MKFHSIFAFISLSLFVYEPSLAAPPPAKPPSPAQEWRWDEFKNPTWIAKCRAGKAKVSLQLASKSGTADNDDMIGTVNVDGKTTDLKLPRALFEALPFPKKLGSACDIVPAMEPKPGQLLLLMGMNDRPAATRLLGILVDLKSKKVLQVNDSIGRFNKIDLNGKNFVELEIERIPTGFRVNMDQGFRKDFSEGGLLFGWKKITVQGSEIKSAWEKPTPSEYNEWN